MVGKSENVNRSDRRDVKLYACAINAGKSDETTCRRNGRRPRVQGQEFLA